MTRVTKLKTKNVNCIPISFITITSSMDAWRPTLSPRFVPPPQQLTTFWRRQFGIMRRYSSRGPSTNRRSQHFYNQCYDSVRKKKSIEWIGYGMRHKYFAYKDVILLVVYYAFFSFYIVYYFRVVVYSLNS